MHHEFENYWEDAHSGSGKFDFVRYALSVLYHFVKLLQDAGREVPDPPVPLWKIVAEQETEVNHFNTRSGSTLLNEAQGTQATTEHYDGLFQSDNDFATEYALLEKQWR